MEFRLVLAALASYRLAQLIAVDEGPASIFLRFRAFVGAYDYGPNGQPVTWVGRLFSCPYCIGVYTSILMAVMVLLPGTWIDVFLVVLGIMGAQCLLETLGHR